MARKQTDGLGKKNFTFSYPFHKNKDLVNEHSPLS